SDAWARHPRLVPWFRGGLLDRARFHPLRDDHLHLEVAGRRLDGMTADRPVAFVSAGALARLPQDAYVARQGAVHELLVSVEGGDDDRDPDAVSNVAVRLVPADDEAPPVDDGSAELDVTLHRARRLQSASFLLPVGAVRALGALEAV